MEVYLLRHGEAGKSMQGSTRDAQRGLTVSGRDEIEAEAEAIAKADYVFDVIASSPLRRARETAEIVAGALRGKKKVDVWPELTPGIDRSQLYRRLGGLKADAAVLLVGHEPFLTSALVEMTGRRDDKDQTFRVSLKKGGLAKVQVTGANPRGSGELRWLLTPKQVRKLE